MSEYMERHEVSRLIGAAPGYIGYEEGGQLTKAVHRQPYSVVLFDEIEKAHPDVFNILLQILEDGVLTDGSGQHVSFANTIIVMTSNLGSEIIASGGRSIGFGSAAGNQANNEERVMAVVKKTFRPEFLNRLDGIIRFRSLDKDDLRQIVDLQLVRVLKALNERGIAIEIEDAAKDFLIGAGYDRSYGARPMRRAIQQHLEDPLADGILSGRYARGAIIEVSIVGEELRFALA
jgi:ATP-dependent Clp protease ATP-binding subunit ClpC